MEFIICTYNIQNKYRIKGYNGIDPYGDHAEEVASFIKKYNVDILGVQEITGPYRKRFQELLGVRYKIVGKYRFTQIGKLLPYVRQFNESTPIVTKHNIISSDTSFLPWYPTVPRIVTIAKLDINGVTVTVLNTHISFKNKSVKKKQLNSILEKIPKNTKNIIIMGDFNCSKKDGFFNEFVDKLADLNIVRVPIDNPTHYNKNHSIDHVFISSNLKAIKKEVIDLGIHTSDHMPVLVKIKL